MAASAELPGTSDRTSARHGEQRLVLRDVSWRTYSIMREVLDEIPGLKLTYLEGALELMSPSPEHEVVKKRIARQVELFALERNVPLYGYGSTTFRREAKERGLEPDECYCLGGELRDFPDIALEVVVTSGGLNKLSVYEGLGVREAWFWIDNRFSLHQLSTSGYSTIERSALVPDLDFVFLAEFVLRTDQPTALRDFRDALRRAT
jgi:Uma2 family endonuclease